MTKFILLGGYPQKADDGGKSFYEELVRGFEEPVKVLLCMFARPEDVWQKTFDDDQIIFVQQLPGKKLEMKMASPNEFKEQLAWADAIYFRGGITKNLLNELEKQEGWKEIVEGKTVAGTSAGANVLGAYYAALDTPVAEKGLGLLPVKVIVHYRSDYNTPNIDWDKSYQLLQNTGEDLPILALGEGQFKVIET
jgi:peptidase E